MQAQDRSENTSLTILNWNSSKNTFAIHTDIDRFKIALELFRERFWVLCKWVQTVVCSGAAVIPDYLNCCTFKVTLQTVFNILVITESAPKALLIGPILSSSYHPSSYP